MQKYCRCVLLKLFYWSENGNVECITYVIAMFVCIKVFKSFFVVPRAIHLKFSVCLTHTNTVVPSFLTVMTLFIISIFWVILHPHKDRTSFTGLPWLFLGSFYWWSYRMGHYKVCTLNSSALLLLQLFFVFFMLLS